MKAFHMYLKLERSLSGRTVEAYLGDVAKLREHASVSRPATGPASLDLEDLQLFVGQVARSGAKASSQARLISAVRAFYRCLRLEGQVGEDPTELLESPRRGRKLPTFLTVREIDARSEERRVGKEC